MIVFDESYTVECTCDFEADPNDSEEDRLYPWHYKRICPDTDCAYVWYSLHCVHDKNQDTCPGCGSMSLVLGGEGIFVNLDEAINSS